MTKNKSKQNTRKTKSVKEYNPKTKVGIYGIQLFPKSKAYDENYDKIDWT